MLTILLAVACGGVDYGAIERQRVLDSFPYVDCGVVPAGARQVCTVPLFSRAQGSVQVLDVVSTDFEVPEGGALAAGAFLVNDLDWHEADCGDGDCAELEPYDDESDDDTLPMRITFAPQTEGYYRSELTIWSTDSESTVVEPLPDDPDREAAIWKVQVRGYSQPACGRVWPSLIDLGRRSEGGDFTASAHVTNCGLTTLEVGGVQESGSGASAMTVGTIFPLYVLPGLTEDVLIGWRVGPDTSGAPTPVSTQFTVTANDTSMAERPFTVMGNDCLNSSDDSWDADDDGFFACGTDCDDRDANRNPSAAERADNGVDDDCDGEIDEPANPLGSDDDGDEIAETGGDCDDARPEIGPAAEEVPDAIDNDCDGVVDNRTALYDDDGDGSSEREGDCDDADRLTAPDAVETQDGKDNDCDGVVDEGSPSVDDDQDGFTDDDAVSPDCDDGDPWTFLGAFEFCDGYDNDCDGVADEGQDDAPDGACAFLPEREDDDAVGAKAGCATAAAPDVLLASALALGAMRWRRRRGTAA